MKMTKKQLWESKLAQRGKHLKEAYDDFADAIMRDGTKVYASASTRSTRTYNYEDVEFEFGAKKGRGTYRWMNRPWQKFDFAEALKNAMIDAGVDKEFARECIDKSGSLRSAVEYFAKNYKSEKKEIEESYSKQELLDAVMDAFGFTKSEALEYIKKASEETKRELVKGFKQDAKKNFNESNGKKTDFFSEEMNDTYECDSEEELENYVSSWEPYNPTIEYWFDEIKKIGHISWTADSYTEITKDKENSIDADITVKELLDMWWNSVRVKGDEIKNEATLYKVSSDGSYELDEDNNPYGEDILNMTVHTSYEWEEDGDGYPIIRAKIINSDKKFNGEEVVKEEVDHSLNKQSLFDTKEEAEWFVEEQGLINFSIEENPIDGGWQVWWKENEENKTYQIQYWLTEEDRDEGFSDIFIDAFDKKLDATLYAGKMVDRGDVACVEVYETDTNKVVFGYDGARTWSDDDESELKEAQGKKEPGVEFVIFDASEEGKAPILGIRSTRVEAEFFKNKLEKTGKYDSVSFDEVPKGKFKRGDDFWGPFNFDEEEKLEESKQLNEMVIDLILDRKDGMTYSPEDFYRDCMQYSSTFDGIADAITRAMDEGTEEDVKKAICDYIRANDYNEKICDFVNSVTWLEESLKEARGAGKGQKLDKFFRLVGNLHKDNLSKEEIAKLEKVKAEVERFEPTSEYEKKDKKNLLQQIERVLKDGKLEEKLVAYDPAQWEPEDIELHKSINWKERNYEDFAVTEDSFETEVVAYGLKGGPQRKTVKVVKHLRGENPIYPPYYRAIQQPFENVVGPMFNGHKHGKYSIHDRYETQEYYNSMSESKK